MLAHRTAAQTSRSDTNPQLLDRLADYIAQTFPEEHRRDVTAATISEVLTQRVCASEEKLLTEVLEDEHGLAAIMLVKERRSPLTGELEGHVCCFAPLRPDLSSEQVANRLQELTDRHGWTCLRTSLFMSDEKWAEALLEDTNFRFGWMTTRKRISESPPVRAASRTVVRPTSKSDMLFVQSCWRTAYRDGLQEELRWQSSDSVFRAADGELAQLLLRPGCHFETIDIDGQPVGFIAADFGWVDELTGRTECYLYDCYVIPERRREGIAVEALQALERTAFERNCAYITGTITGPDLQHANMVLGHIRDHGWHPCQMVLRSRGPLFPNRLDPEHDKQQRA